MQLGYNDAGWTLAKIDSRLRAGETINLSWQLYNTTKFLASEGKEKGSKFIELKLSLDIMYLNFYSYSMIRVNF